MEPPRMNFLYFQILVYPIIYLILTKSLYATDINSNPEKLPNGYTSIHMKVVATDLVDWLTHENFIAEGDVLLFDLDYTIWNGNFDNTPTFDLKYKRHKKLLSPLINDLVAKGVQVFGFTGKPLFENEIETNGKSRAEIGLSLANIKFSSTLDGYNDHESEMIIHNGVIFANPFGKKKSVDAKRSLIDLLGDLTKGYRLIWVDDQDVSYAVGMKFRKKLFCVPFQNQLF